MYGHTNLKVKQLLTSRRTFSQSHLTWLSIIAINVS